jgi:hypothetical protein
MTSKIIFVTMVLIASGISAHAQVNVYPVVFDESIPAEAASNLSNKIDRILSTYGYGSVSNVERMVLSVVVDIIGNNVVPTNPPRITKKVELTFKLGDVVDNKVFGSTSVLLSGIGVNDNKAFISTFSSLKPENKIIKKFFDDVNSELNSYYSESKQVLLNKARSIALTGKFDEAIAYLVTIPPVNTECYSACQSQAIAYYTEKVNQSSQVAFKNAMAAWTSEKDSIGANKALSFLKQVNPASDVYPEALSLWDEISDKLDQDELEAKEHAKQVYEDKVQFRNSILDVVKSIGVAFGENQPQSVTKLIRRW